MVSSKFSNVYNIEVEVSQYEELIQSSTMSLRLSFDIYRFHSNQEIHVFRTRLNSNAGPGSFEFTGNKTELEHVAEKQLFELSFYNIIYSSFLIQDLFPFLLSSCSRKPCVLRVMSSRCTWHYRWGGGLSE